MTIHSAQGVTSDSGVIVDLRSGGFEAYVAASRATSKEAVFLVAPTSIHQLNQPTLPRPLKSELTRLHSIASNTRQEHDNGNWRLLKRRAPSNSPTSPSKRRCTSAPSHLPIPR
ncbi:unnamed protein product, partial [Tilletia controversa]